MLRQQLYDESDERLTHVSEQLGVETVRYKRRQLHSGFVSERFGKSAQRATSFCKAHGRGKRCEHPEGCDKSAQRVISFCIAHGGGK
jgi:hypothetical protein